MNAKKKTIIIAVIAILVVAFIAVAFLATQKSADYYTQIDNDSFTASTRPLRSIARNGW